MRAAAMLPPPMKLIFMMILSLQERPRKPQGKAHLRRQYASTARRCNAAMRLSWALYS
jgi:hypothetical protein